MSDAEIDAKIEEYHEKKTKCWNVMREYSLGSPEYANAERNLDRHACVIQALQWVRGREPL